MQEWIETALVTSMSVMRFLLAGIALLFLGALPLVAGQQAAGSSDVAQGKVSGTMTAKDEAELLAQIRSSYSHTDDLGALGCTLQFDWVVISKLFGNSPDQLAVAKTLQALTTEFHTEPGHEVVTKFTWAGKAPDGSEQMELQLKRMLTGFFRMYWPFATAQVLPAAGEKIEGQRLEDGGYRLHYDNQGSDTVLTTDAQHGIRQVSVSTPTGQGDLEMLNIMLPQFTPSSEEAPANSRQLTALDVTTQIKTYSTRVRLTMEYQTVDGIQIPRRVTFGPPEQPAIPVEFTGCSVSKR